jgi:hypothetical protein
VLPRQGLYPQGLYGLGLRAGTEAKIRAGAVSFLEHPYFGDGRAATSDYRGSRFTWLSDTKFTNPFAPSPAFCFLDERLLIAGSSINLKQLLARQGDQARACAWTGRDGFKRMTSGVIAARISLDRTMPFIFGTMSATGGWDALGGDAAANLPMPEDISDNVKTMELVLGSDKHGLVLDSRAPLPLGAVTAIMILML